MHGLTKRISSSWDVWLGLLLAIAGPFFGWFVLRTVPLEFLILIAGVWLAVVGICWRRPLLLLVGPLFLYEIIRETRRSRYFLLRLYCYLILIILFLAVAIWSATGTSLLLTTEEAARMAQSIAVLLLGAHLLLVTLIAPVYVGGAIADEKERRTLEFLMATELGRNEILLGKLGVRLAIMGLMLLTGLPVLAFLQLVGGLDADFVLGGFVATLAYTFSLACLALYNSVRARRAREAITRTYVMLAGYLIGSWLFLTMLRVLADWWFPGRRPFFPGRPSPSQPAWLVSFFDYLDMLGAGNPFLLEHVMGGQMSAGKTPSQAFLVVFLEFIGFHVIIGLFLIAAAMLSFRKVFKQEQEIVRTIQIDQDIRESRNVGNRPLLWKELRIDATSKPGCLRILLIAAIVLGSFTPAWIISTKDPPVTNVIHRPGWSPSVEDLKQNQKMLERQYANYAFTASTCILCLYLFRIAIHASSSFSRERERHTLDSLLTCPVMPVDLLAAKWGGTMLSIRAAWLWPVAIWLLGTTLGNVPPLAFACLFVFWLIYAGSIACLGHWYSMISSSSTRALLYTMGTLAVLFTGSIALPMQFQSRPDSPGAFAVVRELLFRFQITLSPALVFGRIIPATVASDAIGGLAPQAWEGPMVVVCAAFWLAVGLLLWRRNVNLLGRQMCPSRAKGGNSG